MPDTVSNNPAWQALQDHATKFKTDKTGELHLRTLLQDTERNNNLFVNWENIFLDFSRQNMSVETLDLLMDLACSCQIEEKRDAMFSGIKINTTENRAVLHTALRNQDRNAIVEVDGVNVIPLVYEVLDHIKDFSHRVRSKQFVGCTGKPIQNIVSVGIGGSYLGPEFVFEALKQDVKAYEQARGRQLKFLANVDPVDVYRAIDGLDPETTMVIVVSKTFTTAETMMNARTLKKWLIDTLNGIASEENIVKQHIVAASTAIDKCTEFGIDAENIFGFWDWVGGRYSVASAVGMLPLSLHYGYDIMESFLAGMYSMDLHFVQAPLRSNLPVLLGMLGVWNSSFLGHSSRAILPYSQALIRFAAHIQQVDMESNGKRVTIDGQELDFEAGEINFGEPGTNGQHSFYQLIHQGRIIPCEFIGYCATQLESQDLKTNHDELMSNFFAQADALALGKTEEELIGEGVHENLRPHKIFPGNRPSLSLLFAKLDANSLGQLLALYEHRVFVQGAVWGINSFDQWGVELGKVLAKKVRSQIDACKKKGEEINEEVFNSSTKLMLDFYLKNGN